MGNCKGIKTFAQEIMYTVEHELKAPSGKWLEWQGSTDWEPARKAGTLKERTKIEGLKQPFVISGMAWFGSGK